MSATAPVTFAGATPKPSEETKGGSDSQNAIDSLNENNFDVTSPAPRSRGATFHAGSSVKDGVPK